MAKKISVALLGAELTPLAKVGGLGDVIGALPKTLFTQGVDVVTFLPFYGSIDRSSLRASLALEGVVVEQNPDHKLSVWQTVIPGSNAKLYLLDHPYFSGEEIYSHEQLVGKDLKISEVEKFIMFCQASLAAMKAIGFRPDIIHLNDWHTAPLLAFLESERSSGSSFFSETKTVYTIHNLANQGNYRLADLRLPSSKLVQAACLDNKDVNFMAMGIIGADIVNTVSKTYAKEILTSEQGAGMQQLLANRKDSLFGVVNGIDTVFFNPATDQYLQKKYDFNGLQGKNENKVALQKELGLSESPTTPIFGLVSRLVNQKGLDLLDEKIAKLDAQFIFLGSGQKEVEDRLLGWALKHPQKIVAKIGFDAKLAQQIYAGADVFLMPSKYEPCGLGQMIAMRYGTLPLVRKTGGLADTVNGRNGFVFKKYEAGELLKCLKRAILSYNSDPTAWKERQKMVMLQDFSWEKPAKQYIKLYKKALTLGKM
ncbi:glycogen synthase [Candidatus Falkowbacteria bacterium]|nr:glycogen synthase [Candidatus Falkowbacteria bacterium]